jgi:excisionase family DNA binding protein
MMKEIMTPEQVADYLQLNKDTVYRLIRQNKLAASRIGRTYRIPKEDVQNFLRSHSNRAQVRNAIFERALSIAPRNNPNVSSDDVLAELEHIDEEQRSQARTA